MIQYRATIEEKEEGGFVISYEQYNERFEMWETVKPIDRENTYGRARWNIKPGTIYKNVHGRPTFKDTASWHWSAKSLAQRQIERWEREDKKRARDLRNTVIEGKKLDL